MLVPCVLKLQRLNFLIVCPLYDVVARLTVLGDKEFTRGKLANLGDHLGFQVNFCRLPMLIASESKAIAQIRYATEYEATKCSESDFWAFGRLNW